jgi:isoamylase
MIVTGHKVWGDGGIVSGDRVTLTQSDLVDKQEDPRSQGWLADNVWHPFVNGTGVKQIYNNFASEKLAPDYVAPAKTLSTDWAIQTLSSAGGAILTYTVVGKVAGAGLSAVGDKLGVQGTAARILASDATAQIVGAGLYDFAKAPNPGETRLGNTAASVAAFGMYAAGNHLLASSKTIAESSLYTGLGRVAVGAAGGLTALETSHLVSKMQGVNNDLTWDDRFKAMASGGFVNVAMPPLQKSITRFVDYSINGQPWGKGIPVERYLEYSKEAVRNRMADVPESSPQASEKLTALSAELAMLGDPLMNKMGRDNPLARVKVLEEGGSRANMNKNRVDYNVKDGTGVLAQDLKLLQVAKMAEPYFNEIGSLAKTDAVQAEANYYVLRANMESASRMARNIVEANKPGATPIVDNPLYLGQQLAENGKTYFANWQSEFKQLQANPKYRPTFAFEQAAVKPAATPVEAPSQQAAADKNASGYPSQKLSSGPAETRAKDTPALQREGADFPPSELEAVLGKDMPQNARTAFARIAEARDGAAARLGATVTDKGIDFAVNSPDANKLELLIYDRASDKAPSRVIPMEKAGDTWRASVDGLKEGTLYQYRADGAFTPGKDGSRFNPNIGLIDPEAKAVSSSEIPISNRNGKAPENLGDMPKSIAIKDSYDWKGDTTPNTPMTDTVIYELSVRGYTGGDQSINGALRGTYRGLIEKIPHLKELGITAVELMPIMQGDRGPWPPKNPQTGEQLRDNWNYNPVAFKAPDGSLAADGHLGQQVAEFKDLVRTMHDNKIEVIMDVVFNHTREYVDGPTANLRGLANRDYYLLKQQNPAEYIDHTGCTTTLNTNNPLTQQLIINSLKYWVQEMHVDGFRFDLAPIMKYNPDGSQSDKTPIMQKIETDPVLSKVKLIAEPWGTEQYYLGRFSDRLWSEWNGNYRDTVRKFVKSDTGQTATLADRIAGSPGWFDASKGRTSINFVDCHDGFPMRDLVEYNDKHNWANGENNRDGSNDNFSWNSGVEGPLDGANLPAAEKMAIASLRSRQVKNMMALLMLSRGTPMILAGDEMGRTQGGNNNVWSQDKLNLIDWTLKDKNSEQFNFTKGMIDLRQSHELGKLDPNSFIWRGVDPGRPDHSDGARFIAWQTNPANSNVRPLYAAFNSYWEPITVTLPQGNWFRLVDTNLPSGQDIVKPSQATSISKTYTIQPRSGIVLEGR